MYSPIILTTFSAFAAFTIADEAYMRPPCSFKDGPGVSAYTVRWTNAGTNTTNGVDSAGECGNRFKGELQKRAENPSEFFCMYDGKGNACVYFGVDLVAMARVKSAYKSAFGIDIGCVKGADFTPCDYEHFNMNPN